ncbi:hypothetical protein N9E97_00515 [Planktomarina sp.]|nr:hypothetical protein [Planktomarina sp.]
MANKSTVPAFIFWFIFLVSNAHARDEIQAYFSNDSINGFMLSDAYETHNMGIMYFTDEYYLKLDLGMVSPDMHVYRNEYREANRAFGELISFEIGKPVNTNYDLSYYGRVKIAGKFGIDKLQDYAHRVFSLQPVNKVNDLVRMPASAWAGVGFRGEFLPFLFDLENTKFKIDGFFGLDTSFLDVKLTQTIERPLLAYDLSFGGRLVAYDDIVSAPPINAKARKFIPEISFGVSYEIGSYSIFAKDTFSLPSIETDSNVYGVLSMGASYSF